MSASPPLSLAGGVVREFALPPGVRERGRATIKEGVWETYCSQMVVYWARTDMRIEAAVTNVIVGRYGPHYCHLPLADITARSVNNSNQLRGSIEANHSKWKARLSERGH